MSCLSTGIALMKMTGTVGESSFRRASTIMPVWKKKKVWRRQEREGEGRKGVWGWEAGQPQREVRNEFGGHVDPHAGATCCWRKYSTMFFGWRKSRLSWLAQTLLDIQFAWNNIENHMKLWKSAEFESKSCCPAVYKHNETERSVSLINRPFVPDKHAQWLSERNVNPVDFGKDKAPFSSTFTIKL